MSTRYVRVALSRLIMLAFGIAVGLVALEVVLQGAALLVQARTTDFVSRTGTYRILCLGDSNTYGLFVERDEAWPSRFARTWKEAGIAPSVEIVNLAYPGTNASRVRNQFDQIIRAVDPDLVTLMGPIKWTSTDTRNRFATIDSTGTVH